MPVEVPASLRVVHGVLKRLDASYVEAVELGVEVPRDLRQPLVQPPRRIVQLNAADQACALRIVLQLHLATVAQLSDLRSLKRALVAQLDDALYLDGFQRRLAPKRDAIRPCGRRAELTFVELRRLVHLPGFFPSVPPLLLARANHELRNASSLAFWCFPSRAFNHNVARSSSSGIAIPG